MATMLRPAGRRWLDGALTIGIVGVGLAGQIAARSNPDVGSGVLSVPLAVAAVLVTLPLWWRRRWPLGALAVAIVGVLAAASIDPDGLFGVQVAALGAVFLHAVGSWSTRSWLSSAVVVALLAVLVVAATSDGASVLAAAAYAGVLVLLPAVVGYTMRTRRQYVAEVEARLEAAERDRDEKARRAVIDERQRIARELHDVVAHHVSLIGVQAGAARASLDRSPDVARQALSEIEAASRSAVGEMRQLLDVLSPVGDGSVAPPQPGLECIPALVETWRAAGLEIDSELSGDPGAVAPTVSLCCYRLVEEALTNVARHSVANRASVCVAIRDDVAVEVVDPGPSAPLSLDVSGGRGLIGMRERVALCGGVLEIGLRPDGSFLVRATMPAVPS